MREGSLDFITGMLCPFPVNSKQAGRMSGRRYHLREQLLTRATDWSRTMCRKSRRGVRGNGKHPACSCCAKNHLLASCLLAKTSPFPVSGTGETRIHCATFLLPSQLPVLPLFDTWRTRPSSRVVWGQNPNARHYCERHVYFGGSEQTGRVGSCSKGPFLLLTVFLEEPPKFRRKYLFKKPIFARLLSLQPTYNLPSTAVLA